MSGERGPTTEELRARVLAHEAAAPRVATVAELRRLHVVSPSSTVVHHPTCAHVRRAGRAPLVKLGDDPRYYTGELRPGECCGPVVPKPNAPEGQPGWRWAMGGPLDSEGAERQ